MSDQEKLKGSLPLAAIDTVEKLPEDNNSFKITGPFKHPLILQASDKEECQDWIKAIENGETLLKIFIFVNVKIILVIHIIILRSFFITYLTNKEASA